jgi:diguanylate cyclase (GGDEF)-like protein
VDVVITDIILTGMDGLELTDFIKQNYDIDVIVMTGYSEKYSYEDAINKAASDLVFKPIRYKELMLRLKRVLKDRQLTKERTQMLKTLEKLAITDGLTTLYNSRHFYSQLEIEIGRCNRYSHSLALLLLDIDHFKKCNDTYGHLEGDKVLVRIGQIIKPCLRTMDSAYRYGGEEFTIILPETTGKEAKNVAKRISAALESVRFSPETGEDFSITVSIGVTEYFKKEQLSTFIRRADKAMYKSKEKGRNRISFLAAKKAE